LTRSQLMTLYSLHTIRWLESGRRHKPEAPRSLTPLLATPWHRVILGEAHIIENRNTAISKAVSALKDDRRWCTTGTPIQNRSSDLYILLRFLILYPYDNLRNFERPFVEPWKNSFASAGVHNLQSLFRAIAIRRPKPTIALTTRHEITQQVQFSAEEEHIYETTKKGVIDTINAAITQPELDAGRSYFNTLQRINDLRYICNHGKTPTQKSFKLQNTSGWPQEPVHPIAVGCALRHQQYQNLRIVR